MQSTLHLKSVDCQALKSFVYTPKRCNNLSMTLADRLKASREAAGYTQEELAKKVGIAQQSLQKIEAGIIRNPRRLPVIESLLGLPEGYLLYGEKGTPSPLLPQPLIARCPILSKDKAIAWPANKDDILKNDEILPLGHQIILGANCYALKIDSDAMVDTGRRASYYEGSYIIIDPNKEYKSGNLVVAIEDNTELFFRRYVKEAGREYLFAYNSAYEPIKVKENIKICGVVVAHLDVLI